MARPAATGSTPLVRSATHITMAGTANTERRRSRNLAASSSSANAAIATPSGMKLIRSL